MDLSNLKIKDLKQLIANATQRISEVEKSEQQEVRAKLIAMAKEHGFDALELLSGKLPPVVGANGKVRRPAKPKYRHPTDGVTTWTGRGVKPRWIRDWEASGKSVSGLLIDA